jgi:hypothetical protein
MTKDRTELNPKEAHPAALSAIVYVLRKINDPSLLESLASCAIESNRMAEICLGTINRIKHKQPVSDRYLLGLAWFLKEMEERDEKISKN